MAKRIKPMRLGGGLKDDYAEVSPDGFYLSAPTWRDGKRQRGLAHRSIAWDDLLAIDGELLRPRLGDIVGTVLNFIPTSSDEVDANPRGYLRLVFTLREDIDAPLVVDIPRSYGWRPDLTWLAEFLEKANRAIHEPEARGIFVK